MYEWFEQKKTILLDADLTERWGIQNGSAYIQTHRVNIFASWDQITGLLSLTFPTARKKVGKKFCFDKRWTSKSGFENIVQEGWTDIQSNDDISLHDRIKRCRSTIARCAERRTIIHKKILEELKDKLDRSQMDQSLSAAEVSSIQIQLQKAYEEEEAFWHKKSRNLWFNKGERNTKFYHTTTKH